MADQQDDAGLAQIVPIMTTEHFTLQTARSSTISDSSSRATIFLGTVSSALVALGFIGQASSFHQGFYIFALVLFPTLIFLGAVTFERALQTSIEDARYALGIARIRHFYTEVAPSMSKYFVLATHDDNSTFMRDIGASSGWWQLFLSTAGLISVINSVLAGATAALLLEAFFQHPRAIPLWMPVVVGVAIFAASVWLHLRYQYAVWNRFNQSMTPLFPNAPAAESARSTGARVAPQQRIQSGR